MNVRVSYNLAWANGKSYHHDIVIDDIESPEKAIEHIQKMVKINALDEYPMMLNIEAKEVKPQGNIFPLPGAAVVGRNDGTS